MLKNISHNTKIHFHILDSTAPDVTFPSTLPHMTRASPFVTWTSSEPSVFECALDVKSRIIRCGRGTSGDWNGLNIPHGPHTFWVRGTDSLGNVGEWKPYDFEVGEFIEYCKYFRDFYRLFKTV
jgi:hypothetical protein